MNFSCIKSKNDQLSKEYEIINHSGRIHFSSPNKACHKNTMRNVSIKKG